MPYSFYGPNTRSDFLCYLLRLTEISENSRNNAPGKQRFYQMEAHVFKNFFFEVRFYFSSKKGH